MLLLDLFSPGKPEADFSLDSYFEYGDKFIDGKLT
jgi:hypothetical protein